MAVAFFDNVRHAIASTGTGAITLGTVPAGWQSFVDAGAVDGDNPPYRLEEGDAWENGYLTLDDSATTATRMVTGSSDGGDPLDLGGAAVLTCTVIADLLSDIVGDIAAINASLADYLTTAAAASAYQPLDASLTAFAGLTTAANKGLYFTGADTPATFDVSASGRALANIGGTSGNFPYLSGSDAWSLAAITAGGRALVNSAGTADTFPYFSASNTVTLGSITTAGRNLLDDADAAAQRTTLGLVIGTNVQAQDAELAALAGLTSAADKIPYFTGSGTAALADLSSAMRTFLTTPSSANFAALVSDDSFALNDAELSAIAGLTSAADKGIYFTGSGAAALFDLSSAMRTFLTTSNSANLAAVLTDETGSGGGFVRATGPSLTLPLLSTSATVTTNGTTQGAGTVLTSDWNVLSTVTAANSAAVLPAAAAGLVVAIYNADSADTALIFPASGDAIDALSTNAAYSLPAGKLVVLRAINGTTWYSTDAAALTGIVGAANGGTGVANNAAATLTRSGNHALTLTTTNTTGVTLPTSGTLAILGANTFTAQQTITVPDNTYAILANSTNGGLRFVPSGTGGGSIEAVDPTGGVSFQPLAVGGSTVYVSVGGAAVANWRTDGILALTKTLSLPFAIVTANTTLTADHFCVINNRGASNTLTLPAANTCGGAMYLIVTIQAQTVVSASSNVTPRTGAAASTAILPGTDGAWALLIADSANNTWRIVASS